MLECKARNRLAIKSRKKDIGSLEREREREEEGKWNRRFGRTLIFGESFVRRPYERNFSYSSIVILRTLPPLLHGVSPSTSGNLMPPSSATAQHVSPDVRDGDDELGDGIDVMNASCMSILLAIPLGTCIRPYTHVMSSEEEEEDTFGSECDEERETGFVSTRIRCC